jgi:hypothetical protein
MPHCTISFGACLTPLYFSSRRARLILSLFFFPNDGKSSSRTNFYPCISGTLLRLHLRNATKPHLTLFVRSPLKLQLEWLSDPQIRLVSGSLNDVDIMKDAMRWQCCYQLPRCIYISFRSLISRDTSTLIRYGSNYYRHDERKSKKENSHNN